MSIFSIVMVSLWLYPILGYQLLRKFFKRPLIVERLSAISGAITFVVLLVWGAGVSTISDTADWILLSIIYLFVSLVLWWGMFVKVAWVKYLTLMAMIPVFGFGYFIASFGGFNLNLATSKMEVDIIRHFDEGIIYTEYSYGNVYANHGTKRVKISKTLKWAPFLEKLIFKKEYVMMSGDTFEVRYNQANQVIYLDQPETSWKDSIQLVY